MQHSIEKFLFFALLGIFILSLPVYLNASETDESGLLISPASDEHKNEQTSSGPNNQHTASNVTLQSRWDIYELLFGINKFCAVNWKVILSLPATYLLIRKIKPLYMPERGIRRCYCGGDRNKKSMNSGGRELS